MGAGPPNPEQPISAPRLRAKLATPRTASEQTNEDKAKAKKAGGKEEDKDASEEDGEPADEKKDVKKGATAAATGASGEKARIKAITQSANGKLFPALAAALAFDTDLFAEQA
ncbi:hypothetical protein SAMN02799622_04201 [Methylobacterium sp. UNC378MF]|uniref:Uncharacterized protein n=1 Tax=Methylobacterium oryzae TaxID=334852 RepID=A0ABU7TLD1_9HYPH|nr:hypothetical protein [Methylobacterium sp. UNC378MF]SDA27992.1 hypothetical protein SAMN02799622_04201 [Methylobacterium sp. UNC378MF]